MSTTPSRIHLFDLPVEILREILLLLLTASKPIQLCPCQSTWPALLNDHNPDFDLELDVNYDDDELPPPSPRPLHFDHSVLPLLLAHSRMHAVARPLLYGVQNRFVLDLTGVHHAHVRRWVKTGPRVRDDAGFVVATRRSDQAGAHDEDYNGDSGIAAFAAISVASAEMYRQPRPLFWMASAMRQITYLEMRVDRLRSWIQETLVPVVGDMALRGSLRRLDLEIPRVDGGRRRKGEALLNPPLVGLVGLLADPYLDSARLWVRGSKNTDSHGDSSVSVDDWWARFRISEVGDEVDWRAAVRDVDPEGATFPDLTGGAQMGRYYY